MCRTRGCLRYPRLLNHECLVLRDLCGLCGCFLLPQPRRAADAAGISVGRLHEFCIDAVAEHERLPDRGDSGVEAIDVRQPAAEHDDIGIEQVDDTPAEADTKTAAGQWLAALQTDMDRGAYADPTAEVPLAAG